MPATPLRPTARPARLPEEVVDHVDHLAGVDVHQQRVVIIAHPAVRAVGRRQAILPRIVEPVARAVIARPQAEADREAAIAPAEGIVIAAEPEQRAVAVAMVAPVVAAVAAPVAGPAAIGRRDRRGATVGRGRAGSPIAAARRAARSSGRAAAVAAALVAATVALDRRRTGSSDRRRSRRSRHPTGAAGSRRLLPARPLLARAAATRAARSLLAAALRRRSARSARSGRSAR